MKFFSAKCTSRVRLDGKAAVITGSNTGIGKFTAKDFFERGARVIMACRNAEKAQEAIDDIKKICGNQENLGELVVVPLDLSSLSSIRKCAQHLLEKEKRTDLLINNAGIMMCPYGKTEDGFEMQLGTNHLGHFLLTLLLLPKIIENPPARIVTVSSMANKMVTAMDFEDLNWERKTYSALKAYQYSKLANILFSNELARQLKENHITGVTTYSLHPGVIKTEIGRHLNSIYFPGFRSLLKYTIGWFIKSPEQGAQTTVYCAVDEKCANESGLYYSECEVAEPSVGAKREEDARKLWDVSWKLVGLDDNYNPFNGNEI